MTYAPADYFRHIFNISRAVATINFIEPHYNMNETEKRLLKGSQLYGYENFYKMKDKVFHLYRILVRPENSLILAHGCNYLASLSARGQFFHDVWITRLHT